MTEAIECTGHCSYKSPNNWLSKNKTKEDKSYPSTGLDRPWGFQEVESPRISRQSAYKGSKVVSRTHRPRLPPVPGDIPGNSLPWKRAVMGLLPRRMMNEWICSVGRMILTGLKPNYCERDMSRFRCVCPTSQVNCPGTESQLPRGDEYGENTSKFVNCIARLVARHSKHDMKLGVCCAVCTVLCRDGNCGEIVELWDISCIIRRHLFVPWDKAIPLMNQPSF